MASEGTDQEDIQLNSEDEGAYGGLINAVGSGTTTTLIADRAASETPRRFLIWDFPILNEAGQHIKNLLVLKHRDGDSDRLVSPFALDDSQLIYPSDGRTSIRTHTYKRQDNDPDHVTKKPE